MSFQTTNGSKENKGYPTILYNMKNTVQAISLSYKYFSKEAIQTVEMIFI